MNIAYIRSCAVVWLAAAAFLLVGAVSADDLPVADGVTVPTQAECQTAWDDSSASGTCGAEVVSVYYGSLDAATVSVWITESWRMTDDGEEQKYISDAGCRVEVQCMPAGRGADSTIKNNKGVDNDWSGSRDDAADLQNCNGTLRAGSC